MSIIMAYSQLAKYDSVIWKLIHVMIYFTSFNSKLASAFHKIVLVCFKLIIGAILVAYLFTQNL